MTVVAADGQPVEPVSVDQFRIGVAETYDVIVEPKDDVAYTLFAQSSDRSGYARGTLTPDLALTAPVPQLDPVPNLTMTDMGMAMNMGGMASGDGMDMGGMQDHSDMKMGGDMPAGKPMGMKHDMSKMAPGEKMEMGGTMPMNHDMSKMGNMEMPMKMGETIEHASTHTVTHISLLIYLTRRHRDTEQRMKATVGAKLHSHSGPVHMAQVKIILHWLSILNSDATHCFFFSVSPRLRVRQFFLAKIWVKVWPQPSTAPRSTCAPATPSTGSTIRAWGCATTAGGC